jgi:glutamate racemase
VSQLPDGTRAIGVLDSGVGGLSILREIHRLLPDTPTLYFGDQAHLPYGPRPADEIRRFVEAIADFLIQHGASVIVVACNAASAASLHELRARYPHVPFVGMEPAVKPAAVATRTGVIGVLTTQATADGDLYRSVRERFASDMQVITQVAPELVRLVEQGRGDAPECQQCVHDYLQPMLEAGADQIVLACTHFPFLKEAIQAVTSAAVIDPSAAVARQVARVLPAGMAGEEGRGVQLNAPAKRENLYFTSGDPEGFRVLLRRLIGVEDARVIGVRWADGKIV